ncbi:MAG: ABC transporter ATP-binding protein [Rhodoglobus sp.]
MTAILKLLPVIATRKGLFIETIAWSLLSQAAVLAIALGLAAIVGRASAGEPVSLQSATVVLCVLGIVASLSVWRESWVSHNLAYQLIEVLRGRVFDALSKALPARNRHRRTGDLATAVMADIETLEWLFAHTVAQTLTALVVLGASATVSLSINPLLLIVWVPLLFVSIIVPFATARRARADSVALLAGAVKIRSDLLDTIRGLRELTGAHALDSQLESITDDTRAVGRLQTREAARMGFERGIADIAVALAVIGTLTIVLLNRDAINPADIPLAVTVSIAGLGPAAQIVDLLRNAGTLHASAQRITDILAFETATMLRSGLQISPPVEGETGLVFDDVTFSYDGEIPVLERFTLHVRPGEIVALVGRSGAGKSTAANLALRLWDPDAGAVRINGIDLKNIGDCDLRKLVTTVPQSSPLLRGTIRSNITLGAPESSEHDVEAVARGTGILDPSANLPLGLDTPVGEQGAGLSGGQRARVAIARALLPNPSILVLDEPTASLDPEADAAIMELLSTVSDRAILLIAHRPATIAAAHRHVLLSSNNQPEDRVLDQAT